MVIRGHVENGVIVLDEDVQLSEGQMVTVQPVATPTGGGHSVLDIPTFSVGKVLRPLSSEDDLLEEMLDARFDPRP